MVTLGLLFKHSTTPLGISFSSSEVVSAARLFRLDKAAVLRRDPPRFQSESSDRKRVDQAGSYGAR
jgi:hypothetical protein